MNRYREVINPPLLLMAFIVFLYFSFAFAIWAAFDFDLALKAMILMLLTVPFIWRSMRMVISVDDELRIDRAHLEFEYIGEVKEVDTKEYQLLRGTKSDARSFHTTRPWLKQGVQVFVNDDRDQTTYWLIGVKKRSELLKHIRGR